MSDNRTLFGDRYIEHPWILIHLDNAPEKVLDFGCGASPLTYQACHFCKELVAVDLQDAKQRAMPNLTVLKGDILNPDFQLGAHGYDVILNCSTMEHVGIAGRYGVEVEDLEADLKVMCKLGGLLKPGGQMLLTIPVGRDRIVRPYHRIYGERLKDLLHGWEVIEQKFYIKDKGVDIYRKATRKEAVEHEPTDKYYGLGMFVLEVE